MRPPDVDAGRLADWEVAGAGGIALSLVSEDDKVRKHEGFVDVELNRYVGGAFVGTGLSLWDITRKDSFTPAWMLHAGIPLGTHPAQPVYFVGEGRMFLDNADDIASNYQLWAGVRVHF